MIRVSVAASNSLLVDAIASALVNEISIDVLQLTYREPSSICEAIRDHRSILIYIDEGTSSNESITVTHPLQEDSALLVIKISLKSWNIHICQSYQLANSRMEQVINLVRDFSRTYLNKREVAMSWALN